jgi:hypothetical protein
MPGMLGDMKGSAVGMVVAGIIRFRGAQSEYSTVMAEPGVWIGGGASLEVPFVAFPCLKI